MPTLSGFAFDSAGVAINGATINVYARNTTTPVVATTTTNASGYWTRAGVAEGRYDIEVVNGTTTRRMMYDDEIQIERGEFKNLQVRGSDNAFAYTLAGGAIAAARTLNLPVITGTDTLAVLSLAQTFTTGVKTFNSSILAIRNPADTFSYTVVASAITAARNLTVPLITADDTLAVLSLAQTFSSGVKTFNSSILAIRNPADTFSYTIAGGAITADRTLSLPVITGADTVAVLGLAQTFTGAKTFTGTLTVTGSAGQLDINDRATATVWTQYVTSDTWRLYNGNDYLTLTTATFGLRTGLNEKIGATTTRATTEATNSLYLFDGTAPVGTLTNGISLYSTLGELRVMDSAGNATLLSPHARDGSWVYDSVSPVTGKHLRVDMERMVKFLNEKFGQDWVKEVTA